MRQFSLRSKVFLDSASPELRNELDQTLSSIETGSLPEIRVQQVSGQDFLAAKVSGGVRVFYRKTGDKVEVLDILDVSRFR